MSEFVKILVVDDEVDICSILKYNLKGAGYEVDTANSAEEALRFDLPSYDLILMDIMMGNISGIELSKILKADPRTSAVPVIFITAKDTEEDKLAGFDIGADDYIPKPFSVKEVVKRVEAVLRRTRGAKTSAPLAQVSVAETVQAQQEMKHSRELNSEERPDVDYKTLHISMQSKSVTIDGNEISLTKTEFEILYLLVSHLDKVFSRENIISVIHQDGTVVLDRTVDVNITRIRKKIGVYGNNIATRHGFGYSFRSDR